MSTNTYVALSTQTLTSSASSVTFSSISQSYTDLVIVACASNINGSNYDSYMWLNGDNSSGLYSTTYFQGTGSAAQSARTSNTSSLFRFGGGNTASTGTQIAITSIQNYSNTTTYKTSLLRMGNSAGLVNAAAGLWRNTNAVTSFTISCENGSGSFATGSTFSLYGIAAQPAWAAKATGGTITNDVQYTYHTFTSSGTFTPSQALSCDYLVIAGGAGGGAQHGGGGGAGGLRSTVTATGGGGTLESAISVTATAYSITVGAGGAGTTSISLRGNNGTNSTFSTVTSTGGGGGGSRLTELTGATGGSGGGAGFTGTAGGGAGTANQGFAGGNNTNNWSTGGGGGGAGAVGIDASSNGGNGGSGVAVAISGTSVTYAGGGGAGASGGAAGTGGAGGGGNGTNTSANGANATANTGSGGGAGGYSGSAGFGGAGGSGIVIIRYAN